eukprot:scaffold202921_cov36-Cyclotella_meneghiniana.AAC.1
MASRYADMPTKSTVLDCHNIVIYFTAVSPQIATFSNLTGVSVNVHSAHHPIIQQSHKHHRLIQFHTIPTHYNGGYSPHSLLSYSGDVMSPPRLPLRKMAD